jgi:hypothetical protein
MHLMHLVHLVHSLIQKEIQDIITMRQVGMYVWNMKYLNKKYVILKRLLQPF